MLQNYIKLAVRNLLRNKVYSSINIAGLSLGIACCLLLVLYVQDELSYDKHHARLNDIYRIDTQFESDLIGLDKLASVSPPIAMTMLEEIPEVEAAARAVHSFEEQSLIRYNDRVFYERDGLIADSTIFDVLTYEFIEGNPKKALTDANTIVISKTMARKFFGTEPALDKSVSISQGDGAVNYKITGVFNDDKKSVVRANYFTSMMSQGMGEYLRTNPETANEWAGQNFVPSYLKLAPGHSRQAVDKKMNDVLNKYGAEDMKALGIRKSLFLEPLRDIYLYSAVDKNQRITYLYIILSIAAFILLIACINFVNLSTAKATKRAAEIGIRKVMGAFRSSLIRQMLGEAMVIVLIAIVVGIVLVQLTLPAFNTMASKQIVFSRENIGYFAAALAALAVITGLVAGGYPAFYMSSFQPAAVLKGKFNLSSSSGILRQALVVFQFVIAIMLICGMMVISKQLTFMQQRELGFNSHAKIVLPLRTSEARKQADALKDELLRANIVQQASRTVYVPGAPIWSDMAFYVDGGSMNTAILNRRNQVEHDYLDLLGIKLLAGRNFNELDSASHEKLIINKTSAKKFGFEPDKIVGQNVHFDWQGKKYTFQIIGVMDDYNQSSLKEAIVPICFELSDQSDRFRFMVASIPTENFSQTVKSIGQVWKKLVGDTPFEYVFLDDNIQKQYEQDRNVSKIITVFTVIAMIICSLGLFGLSSYMAERRFKEIGIRKVMGANVQQIVVMMSGEFVKLIGIAFLIGAPVAWYIMDRWLDDFAYKISLDVTVFILAGLSAAIVAMITISYESIRAASANPVKSLRTE